MRAEIQKNGVWLKLSWLVGHGSEVTNEIELDRLFSFVAPAVTMSIFDDEGNFRPGGELEITRGDIIRIFAGEPTEVRVFEGFVDREVSFDLSAETVQFNVIGYGALLKDLKLGRSRYSDNDYSAEQFRRDRYVKVVTEQLWKADGAPLTDDQGNPITGEVEYVCFPPLFENEVWGWGLRPDLQFGFTIKWIFDSIVGYDMSWAFPERRAFAPEDFKDTGYIHAGIGVVEVGPNGKPGVFKRRADISIAKQVTIAEIAEEIARQVAALDPDFAEIIFDPGSITTFCRIKVVDLPLTEFNLFTIQVGDQRYLGVVGWKKDNPSIPTDQDEAIFGRVANGVDWLKDYDMSFAGATTPHDVTQAFVSGMRPARPWGVVNNTSLRRDYIQHYPESSVMIVARLWSWVYSVYVSAGPSGYYDLFEGWNVDWERIDYAANTNQHFSASGLRHLGNTLNLPSVPSTRKLMTISPSHSSDNPPTEYSMDEPPQRVENLLFNDLQYGFISNVLYVSGDLALTNLAFRFEDVTVFDFLVELAKLTNSLVYVDNDKRLHLVRRDYFSETKIISSQDVLRLRMTVRDHWGEPTPEISSAIVDNDDYLLKVARFYREKYFAEFEEEWTIECLPTTDVCQIALLDGIRFDQIGLGDEVTPVIVQRVTLNQDRVTITAVRKRAA